MFFEAIKVIPRVLRVGQKTRINGKFHELPRDIQLGWPAVLKLKYVPGNGTWEDGNTLLWGEEHDLECEFREDGTFSFDFTPAEEGETTFQLYMERPDDAYKFPVFSCYALEEDLFKLRPFKGDTHVHTCWSGCGGMQEALPYVCSMARSRGLDFTFITDHSKIYPSFNAIRAMECFESDFKVYPGEETHVPYRWKAERDFVHNTSVVDGIHHVALGADRGVVEYTNDHFEEYTQYLEKRMNELDPSISEAQRKLMAGVDWLVEKIHEFGGIAVFAHPFWRHNNHLNLPPRVREYIFDNGKFDAVEVIGLGSGERNANSFAGNVECISYLHDKSVKLGRHIPVTGATDVHRAEPLIGYQYTLAFAVENTLENIKDAICSGRTLACSSYPGENTFFWGDFRLVRFAEFLRREFFPEHDERCAVEGKLMLQATRGEISVENVKAAASGCTGKLFREFWAE